MRLIADCGNSTVKLALIHASGVWLHERVPAEDARLDAWVAPHLETIDELVLLPTGKTAVHVEAWWRGVADHRHLRVVGRDLAVPEVGQYPGFGLDRLCAGLAACAQERADVVVVDAGTATTLTAWRHQGPRLLGGLILPGAQACADGLAAGAPALPNVKPLGPDADPLQREVAGAIAAGIGIGHPAMVGACLARLRAVTGITAAVVTGGNAQPLLGDILPRRGYRPSLVCEGVEVLCGSGV